MNLFGVLDVSGSALKAERVRAEVVAANMANAETTRTADGGPYRRQQVVFQTANAGSEQSFAASLLGQGGLGAHSNSWNSAGIGAATAAGLGSGTSASLAAGTGSSGMTGLRRVVPLGISMQAGQPDTEAGVQVSGIVADQSAPLQRYDPQHPDAGPDGYVAYPDINPLTEMVDLMGAQRSYGMNTSAVQAEKAMIVASLDIGK